MGNARQSGSSYRECAVTNREWLLRLAETGEIQVRVGAPFSRVPGNLPDGFDFDRIEGMMLGLAIGDALGNPAEGCTPHDRQVRHGEIRDYLRGAGYPTDDSQLAFWTLEQLLADNGLVPEHLARRFSQGKIFGIGRTVRGFLAALKSGAPWYESGQRSAGNGALMRIAPVLIPHLRAPTESLWADAAICAMITHNHSMAVSSAVALTLVLWELLRRCEPPPPEWWLAEFTAVLRELECDRMNQARSPQLQGFQGTLWNLLDEQLPRAWKEGWTVREAGDRWHSGAYLLETVPCALYTLMRHSGQPEEAIVRAVNDTWDNDTVGAIVGAAVGALYGKRGLPERWVSGLTGRTGEADDGRMFQLLNEARGRWG